VLVGELVVELADGAAVGTTTGASWAAGVVAGVEGAGGAVAGTDAGSTVGTDVLGMGDDMITCGGIVMMRGSSGMVTNRGYGTGIWAHSSPKTVRPPRGGDMKFCDWPDIGDVRTIEPPGVYETPWTEPGKELPICEQLVHPYGTLSVQVQPNPSIRTGIPMSMRISVLPKE
jgi:hypothetical protein